MDFRENIRQLEAAVQDRRFIRPLSEHLNEDGSFDIEGNLQLWEEACAPFIKTYLLPHLPATNEPDNEAFSAAPFFIFIPAEKQQDPAPVILIAHGGGFLSRTGCEGINTAYYFHQAGYNTAILSYRLHPADRFAAIEDMQTAIRLLRSWQCKLQISSKIIVMGFSAGGMLSANCATLFDYGSADAPDSIERFSCRPDACVVAYGAMSEISFPLPFGCAENEILFGKDKKKRFLLAPEKQVTPDTPPFFIWQTLSDDGRHSMNLAKALQDAGVAYELHIFEGAPHGVAMADGENDLNANIPHIHHWGRLCIEWLELHGLKP